MGKNLLLMYNLFIEEGYITTGYRQEEQNINKKVTKQRINYLCAGHLAFHVVCTRILLIEFLL